LSVIFPKWTNHAPTAIAVGGAGGLLTVIFVVWFWFSPKHTDVGYQPIQPIPYSHKFHVGQLGLDCRYCHQKVEEGPRANIPSTETCMNCHAQIKTDSPLLAPLRQAHTGKYTTEEEKPKGITDEVIRDKDGNPVGPTPVEWIKVHMLPDYAYFHHAVHVDAGVGCSSCHGRIDQMEVVRQDQPLNMGWCLECHRDPAPHLRPTREDVFDMEYVIGEENRETGEKLIAEAQKAAEAAGNPELAINPPEHCSACHR